MKRRPAGPRINPKFLGKSVWSHLLLEGPGLHIRTAGAHPCDTLWVTLAKGVIASTAQVLRRPPSGSYSQFGLRACIPLTSWPRAGQAPACTDTETPLTCRPVEPARLEL